MASEGQQSDAERKEAYYLRTQLLVVKLGTTTLKSFFDYKIPTATLTKVLNANIAKINYGRANKHISQQQYKALFPTSGPPKSANFDVSLLCYLLRNVCGLDVNSRWWSQKDNSNIPDTEHCEESDIVRIRNMRNTIQHKEVASLEDNEFQTFWDTMEKAMCRLAAICNIPDMKEKIEEQKNG